MKTNRSMRLLKKVQLLGIAATFFSLTGQSAEFTSGSNGSYGPLTISSNTVLDMPADGIFHCTTIHVPRNFTLQFRNTNRNNSPVFLLATEGVVIEGTVDVSGSGPSGVFPGGGGPGGFAGGYGGIQLEDKPPGDGAGPGAGVVGQEPGISRGVFATPFFSNTNVYGNALLFPLIGGSGGAGRPGGGGGGGGGAIQIASSTSIAVWGQILANEGLNGNGSGGGIRLVAPVVSGAPRIGASLQARPGGRVRIDCTDDYAYRELTRDNDTVFSRGSVMQVFPNPLPSLRIIEAAGTAIPEEQVERVILNLPPGSPLTQQITLQARNFTGKFPVEIVVTPENGKSTRTVTEIDMAAGNPTTKRVDITVPVVGVPCRVQAWKR